MVNKIEFSRIPTQLMCHDCGSNRLMLLTIALTSCYEVKLLCENEVCGAINNVLLPLDLGNQVIKLIDPKKKK